MERGKSKREAGEGRAAWVRETGKERREAEPLLPHAPMLPTSMPIRGRQARLASGVYWRRYGEWNQAVFTELPEYIKKANAEHLKPDSAKSVPFPVCLLSRTGMQALAAP